MPRPPRKRPQTVKAEILSVLCGDDFAMTEGVSRAMLELVDARRLTAVSAMSSMPAWSEMATDIRSRRDRVAIGLHLDLTLRPFLGKNRPYVLTHLVARSMFRALDVSAIAAEFERQFDAFEDALGFAPDHVDGHHHVHALPRVRSALLRVLRRRYSTVPMASRPLVRVPTDSLRRIVGRKGSRGKALIVASLSSGLARDLRASGFEINFGFSGFSRFADNAGFASELAEFLKAPGPRHLIMCHPGRGGSPLSPIDSLSARREAEYFTLLESGALFRAILLINRPRDQPGHAYVAWR